MPDFVPLAGTVLEPPCAAVSSQDGSRWLALRWEPCGRTWVNPSVPCVHADPCFPPCPPGGTVTAAGRLLFHQGPDAPDALHRLSALPAGGIRPRTQDGLSVP